MSASEVASNPFWYAKPTAALTSRDRLSICVPAMCISPSTNLDMTGVGKPVKSSGLLLASRGEPLDLFAAVGWRQCVTIDHRNACSGWVSARALSADDTKVCSIPRLCCGRLTMQCEPTPSAALESCSPRSAQEIENYHE